MAEKKITLGGKEFTLLPVPAIGLRKLGSDLNLIGVETSAAAIDALVDGIYYGLKRADQEITREFVEWNLDTLNFQEMVAAFVDVNTPEKGPTPGE